MNVLWMRSIATLAPLLGACANLSVPADPNSVARGEVTTTSGVKYEDTFLGSGPAAVSGDEVLFDYTLWLQDGTRVDATTDRGSPVRVVLGSAPLKGWNDGLLGIQAQGERRVTVPPELGYGAEGVPGMIPPNSALIFEVHAIQVTHPKK
jgi:FKBP-type peptidyl-prolyl cis-trans isomerase